MTRASPCARLAGVDWPQESCKGRGGGCDRAAAPPPGAGLRGCSKAPQQAKSGSGISSSGKVLPPGRGASPHPHALLEVDSIFAVLPWISFINGASPAFHLVPPPHASLVVGFQPRLGTRWARRG